MQPRTNIAGLILAGGRSSRMGQDKALVEIEGMSLIARSIQAFDRGTPLTVVGPRDSSADLRAETDVKWVREDPPFAGPVAALAAGVAAISEPWLIVIPCDLAHPRAAVGTLTTALSTALSTALGDFPVDKDALIARDQAGKMQWLTGAFRTASLRAALEALPTTDCPVRVAFESLTVMALDAPVDHPDIWEDMDTPSDVDRVRRGRHE